MIDISLAKMNLFNKIQKYLIQVQTDYEYFYRITLNNLKKRLRYKV